MSKGSAGHDSGLDREISLRGLLSFTVGLVGLMAISGALMWWLSTGMREARVAADPPPPLLPEARRAWEPPGPRLQADPPADMAALRAEEDQVLSSWGWTDETAGLAQIPIERAIELLAAERAASAEEPAAATEDGS